MKKAGLVAGSLVAAATTATILSSVLGPSSNDVAKAVLAKRLISERLASIEKEYANRPLPKKISKEKERLASGLKEIE